MFHRLLQEYHGWSTTGRNSPRSIRQGEHFFSSVWLTNVSHRDILRLAIVNSHLVCHVDEYSPRRNFVHEYCIEWRFTTMIANYNYYNIILTLWHPFRNFAYSLVFFFFFSKAFYKYVFGTLYATKYISLDERRLLLKSYIIIFKIFLYLCDLFTYFIKICFSIIYKRICYNYMIYIYIQLHKNNYISKSSRSDIYFVIIIL